MRLVAGLLAGLAAIAAVSAQGNQSAPFFLKLKSKSADLNGNYLYAGHTGALQQTFLLYDSKPLANDTSAIFNWNYTIDNGVASQFGLLTWLFPSRPSSPVQNLWLALDLTLSIRTNVAPTSISSGEGYIYVGWDGDKLYIPGAGTADDSKFVPHVYPNVTASYGLKLQQWYACWVYFGPYYYLAVAWVTTGHPHNPTCEPVSIVREFV
ncbi:hypothetical protein B0T22DRAFT_30972 [Podospora appendiculata]|uniref:DUF7907 domain-containing protein n=1 Tax=Podospora appendiculata TaxID=314037 RepID=A0AAE0XGP6_9PEZI|nr:hypothetical protein B0T22DRAFT_30972 [Podospora appendiculata]